MNNQEIIPTSQIISKTLTLMKEINSTNFNNQLKLNQIKVSLSSSTKTIGCVGVNRTTKEVVYLKISRYYDLSYEELRNTVAHELIHIYEAQVLKQIPAHYDDFCSMMNQLNEQGFNVDIKGKLTHNKKSRSLIG